MDESALRLEGCQVTEERARDLCGRLRGLVHGVETLEDELCLLIDARSLDSLSKEEGSLSISIENVARLARALELPAPLCSLSDDVAAVICPQLTLPPVRQRLF